MSEMLGMHDADMSAVGRGSAAGHAAATHETPGTGRPEAAADGKADGRNALEVEGLRVQFPGERGVVRAASNVCFSVREGQTLGIVGESGCGKSVTLRALCGLVPDPGQMVDGVVTIDGVVYRSQQELAPLRGSKLSMIFQDPASSLNPVLTIGSQIGEVLRVKLGYSRMTARREAIELLGHVGIPEPERRVGSYPHELSGGQRQRAMIAIAIACRPKILLADEPTTALDVTTQEQILKLLLRLQDESGMAIILVTHDLGVVEEVCDEVAVMYAGYVVERASIDDLTSNARHPYSRGLIAAMPKIDTRRLPEVIVGQPPDLDCLPSGCPFAPRCSEVREECATVEMDVTTLTACACPYDNPQAAATETSPALEQTDEVKAR